MTSGSISARRSVIPVRYEGAGGWNVIDRRVPEQLELDRELVCGQQGAEGLARRADGRRRVGQVAILMRHQGLPQR
jgi:hypothetical protein